MSNSYDGWISTIANWNEHKEIVELPQHPDDLNAGMVIPQYELVTVEDGYVRPLYTTPTQSGTLMALPSEPSRKIAGYLIDTPYDDDGVLRKQRKLCIIREGRVVLPALIYPPDKDWKAVGKEYLTFKLGRYPVNGDMRVLAYVFAEVAGFPDTFEMQYNSRTGVCRDIRIRCYYIGGLYQWLHQAKCYFYPAFIMTWGWS
jgi:hypothetical protein